MDEEELGFELEGGRVEDEDEDDEDEDEVGDEELEELDVLLLLELELEEVLELFAESDMLRLCTQNPQT